MGRFQNKNTKIGVTIMLATSKYLTLSVNTTI